MMNDHYKKFVDQTFVEPIRSVVIVDDDYPTIEEVLKRSHAEVSGAEPIKSNKSWLTNPEAVLNVVSEFRSAKKKYILDIHDAQSPPPDEEWAAHLHQTDLLILDYQLDPDNSEDWSRSLKIARKLMSNSHFNLVVVHTNKELGPVFQNYLLGLLSPFLPQLTDEENSRLEPVYDSPDLPEDFNARLKNVLGFSQYVKTHESGKKIPKLISGEQGEFSATVKLFEDVGLDKKYWKLMTQLGLVEYQEDCIAKDLMSVIELGPLQYNNDAAVKWIRSDKAFITFSHKPDQKPLLDCLRTALEDWSPKPSRLLLAKMQAEIEENGVELQELALGDNHSAALWYQGILESDNIQRKTKVDETVRHHVDGMMAHVMPKIQSFAEDLATEDRKPTYCGNVETIQQHYRIDLSKDSVLEKSRLHHNALVCSQEPRGWHVETGHIFCIQDEVWVCVSPLCDMVPAQISASHRKTHGDRLRFHALRLHKKPKNKLPDGVQSNRYIFLRSENDVEVFSITESSTSMPDLGVFFASDAGILQGEMSFLVSRAELNKNPTEETKTGSDLIVQAYNTKVSGHLRYEYALNLVQRIGGALTRVGLDYAG